MGEHKCVEPERAYLGTEAMGSFICVCVCAWSVFF